MAKAKANKPFAYHWGSGGVRFCHYSHRGAFQRSALLMSPLEVDQMRLALKQPPELLALLKRLVE